MATVKLELQRLSEELSRSKAAWEEREGVLVGECQRVEERVTNLEQQNTMLHEEAEKVHVYVCEDQV